MQCARQTQPHSADQCVLPARCSLFPPVPAAVLSVLLASAHGDGSEQFVGGGCDYKPEMDDVDPKVRKVVFKEIAPLRGRSDAAPRPLAGEGGFRC